MNLQRRILIGVLHLILLVFSFEENATFVVAGVRKNLVIFRGAFGNAIGWTWKLRDFWIQATLELLSVREEKENKAYV